MGRKSVGILKSDVLDARLTSAAEWKLAMNLNPEPENQFAKTFMAKANMLELWPVLGAWKAGRLIGAIAWTITIRKPHTANLQLLHTFHEYRRQGVARELCCLMLARVVAHGATYIRISSEPEAEGFYASLGVRFLGRQKSGCLLAVGRVEGNGWEGCVWDREDPVAVKAATRKGKGGCVQLF